MLKNLTPAQQAAIYLHVVGGFKDWAELFQIAEGKERYNNLTDKSKRQTVSKFKRSDPINEGIQELRHILSLKEKEIREDERRQAESETNKGSNLSDLNENINFLNLDEFLQYANQQANNISDEKEKRAWVEMIGKYMNFKESEEGETEQIKAYLPIQCYSCELKKRCEACKFDVCPVEI